LVTLVGLVSKNGILIVEFADELQRRRLGKLDAVREASGTRLRPGLMTNLASVCGHFPLSLVSGAGAAARNSIGLVIVSGMALGTRFTFVLPVIYVLLAKDHHVAVEGAASADEPELAYAE
jgi:multidrug efflux pump